jgi:hypothetical protein
VRNVFPQDRLAFAYIERQIYSGSGARVHVYLDEAATQLASILAYPGGAPLDGSLLVVGPDSLLPEFYGPDEVGTLWALADGGTQAYRLDSRLADRVTSLEETAGHPYHHVQTTPASVWTVVHGLGYDPSGIVTITNAGVVVLGELSLLTPGQSVRVTFDTALAGQALVG